jgi:hypothetical protein
METRVTLQSLAVTRISHEHFAIRHGWWSKPRQQSKAVGRIGRGIRSLAAP